MGKWVLLSEALKYPEEHGDLSRRQVNYVPDQKSVQLTKADTGVEKVQSFSTEKNHTWHPFSYEGEVHLIAGEVTEGELWLYGKVGYENGISSLQKITKLYGNDSLGVEGVGLSRGIFNALPKRLRYIGTYWLCEQFEYKDVYHFGLRSVDSGGVGGYGLYNSNGDTNYGSLAVRPLVHLTSNTLVYIDDSDGPLEIRRGLDSEIKQEILPTEDVYSMSEEKIARLKAYAIKAMKRAKQEYTEAKGLLNLIEQIKKGE